MTCSSHHMVSGGKDIHMTSLMILTFITWLRQGLPRFSTVKLLLFLFHTLYLGSKSLSSPGIFKPKQMEQIQSLFNRQIDLTFSFCIGSCRQLELVDTKAYLVRIHTCACVYMCACTCVWVGMCLFVHVVERKNKNDIENNGKPNLNTQKQLSLQ